MIFNRDMILGSKRKKLKLEKVKVGGEGEGESAWAGFGDIQSES